MIERRDLLQSAAAIAGSIVTAGLVQQAGGQTAECEPGCDCVNAPKLPQRAYGDTGERLSIIGFGGIVVSGVEQEHANRLVAEAVEKGVNYFDVSPSYGDAEVKLGPALEPCRRDVFLACKTLHRTEETAAEELKESLRRLRTDYVDLYQLHAISDVAEDVDVAFGKGGVMKLLVEAKKEGQIRYLGFSAHSEAAALAAMDRYDFDSILFPINFATFYAGDFGPRVLEAAKAKGVARLALKAMARQPWAKDDPLRKQYPKCWYRPLTDRTEAKLGLYFTLTQQVTAAIPPGDESLFRLALDLAMGFRPVSQKEKETLRQLAESLNPIFTRKA